MKDRTSSTPAAGLNAWIELTIDTARPAHEEFSQALFDAGCTGLEISEDECRVTVYFQNEGESGEAVRQRISRALEGLDTPATLRVWSLKSEDWADNWKRFFHPIRVSSAMLIIPAWEPVPADETGMVIRMDPGPAFGTGGHATTQLCLRAMSALDLPADWSFLDVGTGSGILAIAAAKQTHGRILGIDIDPEAVRWARVNTGLNGVSDAVSLATTPLSQVQGHFHLVAANLIYAQIIPLLEQLRDRLRPDGRLLLSGLLTDQTPEILRMLPAIGLREIRVTGQGEWSCILAQALDEAP